MVTSMVTNCYIACLTHLPLPCPFQVNVPLCKCLCFSSFLCPQLSLEWRPCADLPVGMSSLQSVVVGGKVYVGGGTTYNRGDLFQLFCYDPEMDGWSALPLCPVAWFGLGEFQGLLVTVGGVKRGHDITGKLYCYNEASGEWEEYLKPMPTARAILTVITTQSAIIACGGKTDLEFVKTVEVYRGETDHWHTANPLPIPWTLMTSVSTADTCYLLGGKKPGEATTFAVYASLSSLVEEPTSSLLGQQSTDAGGCNSVWMTLPNTPLKWSTAAGVGRILLAVGGSGQYRTPPDVHMFSHETNYWPRVGGKIPAGVYATTVATMADGRLLVCGGLDGEDRIVSSVYIGSRSQ